MLERLLRFAAGLYPRSWRSRYGAEFAALLDEARPKWSDVWDISKGALIVQIRDKRFTRNVAFAACGGMALAALVASFQPAKYRASAVLRVERPDLMRYVMTQALSRSSLAQIILSRDLYHADRYRHTLETIVEKMRRDITLTPGANGRLAVAFRYPDREAAMKVVSDLMVAYQARARRVAGAEVEVVDTTNDRLPWTQSFAFPWLAAAALLSAAVSIAVQMPRRWTWRVALCGVAGCSLALAFTTWAPATYVSTAVVTGDLRTEPPPGIVVRELSRVAGAPRVYEVVASASTREAAQNRLREWLRNTGDQVGEPLDAPSLPEIPVRPRNDLALPGLLFGLGIGAWLFRGRARAAATTA